MCYYVIWNWKIYYKSTIYIYIYRVTPVHYLQKTEKKTRERTIQYGRGEEKMATTLVC